MSEFLDRVSKLSPQRLALLADELNERLQAAERRRNVPLAIVGIGCNFPGGIHSPEDFWTLLRNGGNAVKEVPSTRWDIDEFYDPNPETPGKMATRWGGFIEGHDQFDPKFFGIAPAEAVSMDPQQRLLLETAWEALEHAAIAPSTLSGTGAGVFVGICNGDYGRVALWSGRETITPYFASGLSHAVASGRISYVLGLQGPSIAVDTSCSASLVAVHLACQSLRLQECEVALAGGVNLIFNPDVTIALSQSKMMAPDGRCKAFSDTADGFVRGEGCGMIVLKRLPDAVRDRNRILAVIRGSACNQDGRSSGLTAPNGPSQEAVLRNALKDAGMRSDEVDVIEAHGTGTALGDPIEAGALNAVFSTESRKAASLFVGSVKTNLGHLESAAGIAGLIKLVLAIEHGEVPPSLHFEKPSSRIEWLQSPIQVPTKLEEWKRRGQKRAGGVSSFGFSGTNAHVIVEEYPRTPTAATEGGCPFLFPLSARTPAALKRVAARLREYLLQHPEISLGAVAYTLAAGRSHFEYRAGFAAASREELNGVLAKLEKGEDARGIHSGRASLHAAPMTLNGEKNSRDFLDEAAALYVSGCVLDLDSLYDPTPDTVALPTYPFERERYWIETETSRAGEQQEQPVSVAHVDAGRKAANASAESIAEEWVYDLIWEPKPLAQKLSKSTAEKLDNDLLRKIALTPATPELMRVEHAMNAVMPVYASYILQAFRRALPDLPVSEFTLDELSRKMDVLPARQRALGRMLDILVEDGVAEKAGDRFRFIDFAGRPDPDRELEHLSAKYPECTAETNVLRRCGKKLLEVLQGGYDPMQLVFSDGSIDEAEQIYEKSPVCRFFNNAAANIIRSIAEQVAGGPVRILEIGAGTGATTKPVLAALADGETAIDYTFTDISPVFLSHARVKFAQYSSVNYRLLNVEQDPQAQGFEPGQYDIILAANVLHATADLRQTIAHARSLLAPGGFFVLLEGVRPNRWLDMTFGLTDGWWRSADRDLRPGHPFISAETWKKLLHDAGMSFSRTASYVVDDGTSSDQTLIVAQRDEEELSKECGQPEIEPRREWIILGDDCGIGDALGQLLKDRGESCRTIPRGASGSDIAKIFDNLEKRCGDAVWNVVYLGTVGKDHCDVAREIESSSADLIHCAQRLVAPRNGRTHLWIATRGAQPVDSFTPSIQGSIQAMAWGAGRVIGLEFPDMHRATIDLDPALAPEAAAGELLAEILQGGQEDEVAYRNGARFVSRLQHSRLTNHAEQSPVFDGLRQDASYLLVGGLGGVGLRLAQWAAEQRAGHLVLLSRTGTGKAAGAFAKERIEAIADLQTLGTKVTVVEADVASEPAMKALFRRFGDDLPPLRGIFQCATEVHGAALTELKDADVVTMLRPKVQGTLILHELTRTMELDFFLAFSSTTSVFGAKGMAHYAAANQFLDSFAHFRRGCGLPMLSINWGAWDVIRRVSEEDRIHLKDAGLLPMDSNKLLKRMGNLIVSPRAQVVIANIDWKTFKPLYEVRRRRPLLKKLDGRNSLSEQANTTTSVVSPENILQSAYDLPEENRKSYIEEFVKAQAARVLGYRRDEVVPPDVPLMDLGLDSLMAVDLRNHLQTALGQEMSPTVVFDYPTVSEIADMLEARLWASQKDVDDALALAKDEIRI